MLGVRSLQHTIVSSCANFLRRPASRCTAIVTISFFIFVSVVFRSSCMSISSRKVSLEGGHIVTTIYKTLHPYQKTTLSHLCVSQPQSTIYVICIECVDSIQNWYKYFQRTCKERMKITAPPKSMLVSSFMDSYVHLSSNDIEYERFCFVRHLYIKELLESTKLPSFTVLDTDMIFFKDISDILPAGYSLSRYSTFFLHWETRSFTTFVEYLNVIFRLPLRSVLEITDKFGLPDINVTVPGTHVTTHHFSDMCLLMSFFEIFQPQIVFLCDSECPIELLGLNNAREVLPCGNSEKTFNLTWKQDSKLGMVPYEDDNQIYGLHLQGDCKKILSELPIRV